MGKVLLVFIFALTELAVDVHATTNPKFRRKVMSSGTELLSAKLDPSISTGEFNIGIREDYLLQDCGGNGFKQSFPDIDYSLFGYNVLRGYPMANGHDPGFTLPIFVADYTDSKHTADCRYSLPKGFVVVPDVSCDISFTSTVTQNAYQFASSLSASAKVSGGGWGVSFSASAGYSKAKSELSSGETVYIISTASCTQYFSKLIPGASPDLDPLFSSWIDKLRSTNDEQVYFQFFDTFGTHFPTMVTYGAKFSQENKMNSQTYEKKVEEGVNVAVEASYSGLFSVGGGFGLDSSQRQQASDFQKSVETKTVTVGAAPPSNGDAMTWASNVKNNPVPVNFKIESIENLFNYLKPNSVQNVQSVIDNISKYKMSYCNKLVKQGEVNTCEYQKPGLELKGTRLAGHFRYDKDITFSQCIDNCLDNHECLALTYCVDCVKTGANYRTCYMYGNTDDKTLYASSRQGWWSYIILGKIKSSVEFDQSSILGTPIVSNKKDKRVNKAACQEICEKSTNCIAFTHIDKPRESWKCRMYRENIITGFKGDSVSSITVFGIKKLQSK